MLRGGTEEGERARDRPLPTGVVTFLFTDIEGSTALLRSLGPAFAEVLDAHNRIIRAAVDAAGGTEIRTEGDSFFCAFANASDAVAACLEAQRALHGYEWPPGAVVRVRMGLHTGEAEHGGDDYISLAIHQAARVVDAAHGGQVLVSETTRAIVGENVPRGAALEPLGRYRLRDFAEPPALFGLRHPDLPSEFPTVRALPAAAHNVPEPATLFVGRATALRELAELVCIRRLTTVVGAGGVGKTRLATEVVPIVAPRFADGVWMVELARLERSDAVAPEVATMLGIRLASERTPTETVADALASRELLLVLDNCEHVLDAVAELVQQLIARCPEVNVLATSRSPVGLPVESRYPLAPLRVPGSGEADAASCEAVALFVERARVVAPNFDLDREQRAVIDICRRLDGLPLAIELAAARTASISPARIAQRLDRRFSVLKQSYRGALPHHATLHASIAWSYDLLEPDEQAVLRRLGAFTGEFDIEAAEAVCSGDPIDEDDVLDLLGCLVDKSLVQRTEDRYFLLETIREFALERLAEAGEADVVRAAHLSHYARVVEEAAADADGPRQRDAYDRLDADLPNIRAAAEWALEHADPAALRLGAALGQYGFVRNRLVEVMRWCTEAVRATPDAPAPMRARALMQAGFACVVMGSATDGLALVDEAVALAREAEDERLLVETLLMAADLRLENGMCEAAQPYAGEALELAPRLRDDWLEGRAIVLAARSDEGERDAESIYRRLQEGVRRFERAGDARQITRVLMTMAYLALAHDELDAAERDAVQCSEIIPALGHPIGTAVIKNVLVWVALERGEGERARSLLDEIVPTAVESGYVALLGYCAAARAALSLFDGEATEAAQLLGAIEATEGSLGGEGGVAMRRRVEALTAEVRARLGEERWEAERGGGARRGLAVLLGAAT